MSKKLIRAGIAGIGIYVPKRRLSNSELEGMVQTSDEWIRTRTGIAERRIASPDEATSDMSVIAGKKALENAGVKPENIDLIIVATVTPDMIFPATACLVQERLGAKRAAAFDLEAGCSGFVYALSVASQFITSGTYENVLVIGADTLSRITNWQDPKTCVLMGDGAGAVVLKPSPEGYGILSIKLGADGSGGMLLNLPAGGSRLPASEETIAANLHTFYMNGREVFKFAVKIFEEVTVEALSAAGLCKDDIDLLIPHQANIRIIDAAAKKLNLPLDKVLVNIDRYGNTSSASIPLALWEGLQTGRIKQGNHLVMVGFGSGLSWGALVIKWCD
ncbi:beta-ketoacyl-ACP synthase III [Desulforamulus aquiferis]|uniref:Beta-ketoacyl-[acyl-carrier-protein] synthase III n=1 Tax=Desulforamulus aquiferis TaxID=1397668 RepID=A0AAW7ZDW2_9FIRM|nr:beta-ketoacyl-ACP synthase III [Desulforamulus aquiferis]MDO7787685.1 ketoacyl-ACP synthase III [Desulforamulus aquiferis]RYD05934.1 hypothetical protein N752_06730 [Desulforamulus aquiferis]